MRVIISLLLITLIFYGCTQPPIEAIEPTSIKVTATDEVQQSTQKPSEEATVTAASSLETMTPTVTLIPEPTLTPSLETEITSQKEIVSCADPELIEEVRAEFQQETGMTVQEMVKYQLENGYYSDGSGYSSQMDSTTSNAIFLGFKLVSINHLDGAHEGDQVMCAFVGQGSEWGGVAPIITGYTYQGQYYNTAGFVDVRDVAGNSSQYSGMAENAYFSSLEEMEALFNRVKYGDSMVIDFQQFSKTSTREEFDRIAREKIPYKNNIGKLIELMGWDYLARLGDNGYPASAVKDLSEDDLGLFVGGFLWEGQK